MATEYNTDTNTLTLGGKEFKLDDVSLTIEQIRERVADIPIGNKKIGDFYNHTLHTFVNVASIDDEVDAQQRVVELEKLVSDVKRVSNETINVIVRDDANVSSYEGSYLNLVTITTVATKIIAGVLIVQNVGSQLCSINKQDASSPKLEELTKKVNDVRALLDKTTRLLFSMETIPQN
jgi:hypothetical protein